MTTIAWDGKTLASDQQLTADHKVAALTTKIAKRKDGAIIGIAGEICVAFDFMRWFLKGEKGKRPSLKSAAPPDGGGGAVLIIRKDGKVEDHDKDGWHPVNGRAAIGSGATLALLAMDMGANAEEAIKLTSRYDIYTSGPVDTLELGK